MATIRLRDCDFAYDFSGAGGATPFVWGHGLTSSRASEDRMPLVDCSRLAAGRRVLRYDARGHGESGDLIRSAQGAWSELALDQIALIDELGLSKSHSEVRQWGQRQRCTQHCSSAIASSG